MTKSDYTVAAVRDGRVVVVAQVTHVDLTEDESGECEGHESTSGPIGNVTYCDGSCSS